jgi:mannosyltransferase OCH1-like enzyme
MAILQKYGGYYLDNDVLTIQRFTNLHNAIALDHVDMFVNNNFLAFDKGHPFISDYMEYISET